VIFQIPIAYTIHNRFIFPETRWKKQLASNNLLSISMVVEDFVLTLEAKESAILDAGCFLWLSCKSLGR